MTSSADSLYQLAPIEISVSFTFEVVSMESVEPDERKTKADKETKENIKILSESRRITQLYLFHRKIPSIRERLLLSSISSHQIQLDPFEFI